MGNHH